MKIYSWKTRASCGQPTSGLHFQFEFHITVLRYMGRVSVKQFVTNCNIKNMRFLLCTVYLKEIYSILGSVLPLQKVALLQSPVTFSVICCPCPHRSCCLTMSSLQRCFGFPIDLTSFIHHSVLLMEHLCPFPFRVVYVFNNVCNFGSLPNVGVADYVCVPNHRKINARASGTFEIKPFRSSTQHSSIKQSTHPLRKKISYSKDEYNKQRSTEQKDN